MRRLFVVGSCLFALATASCAAIFGFDRLSEGAPDAGSDADPRCLVTGYPETAPATSGGDITVIGALRRLDFGLDGGGAAVPGFNLDHVCSPTVETGSCSTQILPATYQGKGMDRVGGLDNAAYNLIARISEQSGTINAQTINQGVTSGAFGATIRVKNWNGLANDQEVVVEVFPALGASGSGPDGGIANDENDDWKLSEEFQVAADFDQSKVRSESAWVSDGELVAQFKTLTLQIFVNNDPKPFDIALEGAVITGRLEANGSTLLSSGTIAGRWRLRNFLDQVRKIYINNGNDITKSVICDGNPLAFALYKQVRDDACDARDVRADSREDNRGLPCDSVSAAASIEAYRTKSVGTWIPKPDGGARCAADAAIPDGVDCP